MSTFFLLILFLLACSSTVLSTKEDEIMLLKIEKQLGNPDILSKWVKGFEYCGIQFFKRPHSVYVACTDTGRVSKLVFRNINVSAIFPYAICSLPELVALYIYNWPGLHGPIPPCIHKLVNLSLLVITETSLSDSLPNFSKNTNLIGITLSSNHLSGTIPLSLSKLQNLRSLDLSSNNITGTIPLFLSKLQNLSSLDLSSNYITGTIPPFLSKLQNLSSLDLSSNYITGTIPPKIVHGDYPKLFLSNNNMTGEIPKSHESVNFETIDVGNNQLSGDASFLFGEQKTTYSIVLANNDFEFDLSFVKFSSLYISLYILDISHNKIYGNMPDSIGSADFLSDLNLSFNRLCGELPKSSNMGRFNAEDFENNTCLCGYPLPPCSNIAPTPESTTP